MPNHYTTIAICTPAWDFDADAFTERMKDISLCSILRPIPDGMENTVEAAQGGRRWTVRQGEDFRDSEDIAPEVVEQWIRDHGYSNGLDWQVAIWGTKWGDYGWHAMSCMGDAKPAVISFVSAWAPPSILEDIGKWLSEQYHFEQIRWVGVEPYDDSIPLLGEQRFEERSDA